MCLVFVVRVVCINDDDECVCQCAGCVFTSLSGAVFVVVVIWQTVLLEMSRLALAQIQVAASGRLESASAVAI